VAKDVAQFDDETVIISIHERNSYSTPNGPPLMRRESPCGRPPPAGATYLGSLDLAPGVLLVDLAAGLAPGGVGV